MSVSTGYNTANKRPRSSDRAKDKDRISNLPESVMCHILSRLTAKQAVRTCVLSKNWERKWTSIYNISIDDMELYQSRNSKFLTLKRTKANFSYFVERLLLVSQNAKRFCLSCREEHEPSRVVSWISTILRRKVENLEVILGYDHEGITLPPRLLSCTSLRNLKLQLRCTFKVPAKSSLPILTALYLKDVKIQNENLQADTLRFTFPMLKTFELHNCKWFDVKLVDIYAPKLTTFRCSSSIFGAVSDYSIKITAKRVAKFESFGGVPENINITGSLKSAVLKNYFSTRDLQLLKQVGIHVRNLLKGISSLEHLMISNCMSKAMGHAREEVPLPLCQQLGVISPVGADGLVVLLTTATYVNLRTLDVDVFDFEDYDDDEVKPLPHSWVFGLEEVKLDGFSGTTPQLNLVKFLLKHGAVLRKVHLSCDYDCNKGEIAEKLSTFPKRSTCLMVIID